MACDELSALARLELEEGRPPIPTDGVSLAALRAFRAQHAGRVFEADGVALRFEALTTAQVCALVTTPATAERRCAYVQLLAGAADAGGAPLAGRATHFVSHAWAYPFAELLAALEAHAAAQPGLAAAFLWLDVFSVNQHHAAAVDQAWWAGAFRAAVAAIGHTLLVLQPWHAPVPLTRSWCLWELLCTLDGGARLDCLLSPAQSEALHGALLDEGVDIMEPVSRIDARAAQAFLPEDRAMIAAAVEASAGGFGAVNGRVFERLREWLVAEARAAAARVRAEHGATHERSLAADARLAQLLGQMDARDEAARLLAGVLAARRAALGDVAEATLGAAHELAVALGHTGRHKEAAPLFLEALRSRRALLGDAHADSLATANAYGCLLRSRAEQMHRLMGPERDAARADAERLFRAALAGRLQLFGAAHLDTLASKDDLAILLRHTGRLEEAEPLFREALAGRTAALGERHPATLQSLNGLATLLGARGRHEEEAALHLCALRVKRETLGELHKSTLDSAYNHAHALEARARAGGGAPATLSTLQLQLLADARAAFQRVLDGYRATLNERDRDIDDCARRVYMCDEWLRAHRAAARGSDQEGGSSEDDGPGDGSHEEGSDEGWYTDDGEEEEEEEEEET